MLAPIEDLLRLSLTRLLRMLLPAVVAEMYSAFANDRATVLCFHEAQVMTFDPRQNTYQKYFPVVNKSGPITVGVANQVVIRLLNISNAKTLGFFDISENSFSCCIVKLAWLMHIPYTMLTALTISGLVLVR